MASATSLPSRRSGRISRPCLRSAGGAREAKSTRRWQVFPRGEPPLLTVLSVSCCCCFQFVLVSLAFCLFVVLLCLCYCGNVFIPVRGISFINSVKWVVVDSVNLWRFFYFLSFIYIFFLLWRCCLFFRFCIAVVKIIISSVSIDNTCTCGNEAFFMTFTFSFYSKY